MATSSSQISKSAATGILQSSLSPKYLHTNSTSHTWPFSAVAELIDNAYDPDVKASQLWIDRIRIHGQICLTFTDNGNGMQPDKLHKMLSFGFCEKTADGEHMPVGHYGNGFKSGSMRLGKDALVLTKQANTRSVGYLSQTYLELIKAETVVVPIVTWDKKDNNYILRPRGIKALKDIFTHSVIKSEDELNDEFDKIPIGNHGTRIIISNIRKTTDSKPEFDFATDEYDIRIPDDSNSESEKYRRTQRQNHVPECDYSLRAYCAILYLKPKMQIILRQKKVKTLVVEKSLSKTEVDRYKPTHAATGAVKVVFGFNSRNKNHYGIMMYHRNRLIKPYERVGHQLKANNLGVGVVGVVQCDFLQPTHNKQDFDYTKAYRACIYSLGVKLNEYWNEKKGPVKSSSQNNVDQPISEPQEIQSIPDQTWVQCDEPTCLKWRKLRDGVDPDELPEKWYCSMNPDINFKSCDVPEEKDEDTSNITPYAKVQKSRLVREMEEKKKREKAARLEQEEKLKTLEKKEEILKKKEEILNKKLALAQLQESKPKIKVEGGSLPTAQVAPRSTMKPLNAVTPTAKPSPRQIGSQLAARLAPPSQSPSRTAQSNQSGRSPAKHTPSPARSLARSTPSQTLTSQSTPRSALSSQSTPRFTLTSQSITSTGNTPSQSPSKKPASQLSPGKITQPTRTPTNTQFKLLQPKTTTTPQTIKLVTHTQAQKLGTTGITFKMMKTKNGNTYIVQEKNSHGTATTPGTKPYATVVRASGPTLAAITALGTGSTPGSSNNPTVTMIRTPNTNVDVKPRLNVLPKPQASPSQRDLVNAATTANDRVLKVALQTAAKQKIVLSALKVNSAKTVAKSTVSANVMSSNSLGETAYSEITGNTSTTPEDVKNILQAAGIKREATDTLVSPIPAKVQRQKSDAAVIVIDPLPSQTQQRKHPENAAEKRVKELESRVKELEKQIENIKGNGKEKVQESVAQLEEKVAQLTKRNKEIEDMQCDGDNKMAKVVIRLEEKSAQLIKRNKEVEELRGEINSKKTEANEKVKELKVLRGNVCRLLQVLVPEIDVECEGNGEMVDDLLKQVLEANQ